jgi:hypothetical protein
MKNVRLYNNTVCTALEINLNLYKKEYMRARQKNTITKACIVPDS